MICWQNLMSVHELGKLANLLCCQSVLRLMGKDTCQRLPLMGKNSNDTTRWCRCSLYADMCARHCIFDTELLQHPVKLGILYMLMLICCYILGRDFQQLCSATLA